MSAEVQIMKNACAALTVGRRSKTLFIQLTTLQVTCSCGHVSVKVAVEVIYNRQDENCFQAPEMKIIAATVFIGRMEQVTPVELST